MVRTLQKSCVAATSAVNWKTKREVSVRNAVTETEAEVGFQSYVLLRKTKKNLFALVFCQLW